MPATICGAGQSAAEVGDDAISIHDGITAQALRRSSSCGSTLLADTLEKMMRSVLVPVDGSDCSDRAVQEVIATVEKSGPLDIHLINVQPPIFSEPSLIYLPPDKLDTFYFDQGEHALASAQKLLKAAGLGFTVHRAVGSIADTIVAKAHELGADSIVMGTHGRGKVSEMLLGSVCLRVVHLSDIPVTVVRGRLKPDFGGRIGIA